MLALIGLALLATLAGTAYSLNRYRATLIDEWQEQTLRNVENAYNIISYYYEKSLQKTVAEEDAKNYALEAITKLSTDKNGYFWVMDTKGVLIQHPTAHDLIGRNLINYSGPDGTYLFREMMKIAQRDGGGFVRYAWPKPDTNSSALFSKTSYVKHVLPWSWIVGSGNYVDEVETTFRNAAALALAVNLIFCGFLIAFTVTVSMEIHERKKK